MIVASIALAASLGGSGYAAVTIGKNSVRSPQVVNESLTGADIRNGSIGPRDLSAAARAGARGPAGPAGPPGPAAGAAGGDLAGTFPNPSLRDGSVTGAKLAPLEAWRQVGSPGQPAFAEDWRHFTPADNGYEQVGLRIDRDGIVHLRGAAARAGGNSGSNSEVFTLPEGYRPRDITLFGVMSFDGSGNATPGAVQITPDGQVRVFAFTDDRFVPLWGVSFDTRG